VERAMPIYEYVILAVGWIAWFLPFPLTGLNLSAPAKKDPNARWGILLELIAFTLLWQGHFWARSPGLWRLGLSIPLLVLAALLSWTGTRALGHHLRLDAALSADHQLVRSGPYRVVRHPIYASMLCLLLGTGFMLATPLLFAAAIVVFLVGTEIRVQTEDRLLAARFGEEFRQYRKHVRAYVPFVR
jgi:protein-S-isoprenylcysteine O-methyltransferase Ste14